MRRGAKRERVGESSTLRGGGESDSGSDIHFPVAESAAMTLHRLGKQPVTRKKVKTEGGAVLLPEPDVARNRQLQQEQCFLPPGCPKGTFLPVSKQTGCFQFKVDKVPCDKLARFVTDGANRDAKEFLKIGSKSYPGFGGYVKVAAKVVNTTLQEKLTSIIPKQSINHHLFAQVPGLGRIVAQVLQATRVHQKHLEKIVFNWQKSSQAIFAWHNDEYDFKLKKGSMTVVVNLNEFQSKVAIAFFEPHQYDGVGDAVAFPALAQHRTLTREEYPDKGCAPTGGPLKLTLFFH